MKLNSSVRVPAARNRVFAAFVDPNVLRHSVPGCEELTANGADVYEARLKLGVAGLKGTYTGRAELREKHPPESLTLAFEAKGGPGFVHGAAAIRLADEDGETRVTLDVEVQVGGPIAAVGSRLIEAAARKLTNDFFRRLTEQITDHHQPPVAGPPAAGPLA